jgi:hypothetical protein
MNQLSDYNTNLYLKVCSFLNNEMDRLNNFICEVRSNKDYSKLLLLEKLYIDVFQNNFIKDILHVKIERVLNPHYSLFTNIKPEPGNSTFFISLKLKKETLIELDELYSKQLTNILRLYKNIFSIIDKPSYNIQEEDLIKYENLIRDLKIKMKDLLLSEDNKKLIEKRDKLKYNVISNLPHSGFYHMTHFDNLDSILSLGLLSHMRVYSEKKIKVDISNQAIQNERNRIETIFGRNIQDYVPLYINPQNPMMDSEKVKNFKSNILLLEIIPHILVQEQNTLFSDGNAAQLQTNFYHNQNDMENINWKLLQEGKWIKGTESHRMMCSEVLVPERVQVYYLNKIILRDDSILKKVMQLFPNHKGIEIIIDDRYFITTRLN